MRENPLGQTTASWVASLAPDKVVHWVTGTAAPCTGLFKPVLMETGLPSHGTQPGGEEDHTSLWWRHEQLRRRLDEVIAEMGMEAPQEEDLSTRRQEILAQLSRGEINVQEATRLLSQLKGDRS